MAGDISRLARLPVELTSLVVGELDAKSLGVLRLASKHINAIFTPWFLRHVNSSQTIEFTIHGIKRLHSLSLSAPLRSIVRTIRFISPYYHVTPAGVGAGTTSPGDLYPRRRDNVTLQPIDFLKTPGDRSWLNKRILEQSKLNKDLSTVVSLLTGAFRNLKALDGISLEAAVVLGPEYEWPPEQVEHLDWRPMWAQNMNTFRTIVSSIAESQIQLETIELFKNTDLCSIPINELFITQTEGFEKIASSLKHFSISLSSAVREPFFSEPQGSSDRDLPRLERNIAITRSEAMGIDDMTSLLGVMKSLETLHIHFYQTCWFNEAPTPFVEMLEKAFHSAETNLNHLTRLSLLCVPMTPTTIETILTRCPKLEFLSLRLLQLDQDSWVQALTPLVSSSVKSVYLSNLFVSDYSPGFRVLHNKLMRDVNTLCDRHPNIEKVIQGRDDPSGAELRVPQLGEKEGSLLLEVDPELVGNWGFQSLDSMRLMRLRQRLCGPPCRQGQHIFGSST